MGAVKYTLEVAKKVAAQKGGKCLSDVCSGIYTKLLWQCSSGHTWTSVLNNVVHSSWCPICGRVTSGMLRRKYSLENFVIIAKQNGGKCLSDEYGGLGQKLQMECNHGHQWLANPYDLVGGKWCPEVACRGAKASSKLVRTTLDDLGLAASKRNGSCLSNKYFGYSVKHRWLCSEGHQWEATPASIFGGSWCPDCGRVTAATARRIYGLRDLQDYAARKGGKCLSPLYGGYDRKHKFTCVLGHVWETTPEKIFGRGSWCPHRPCRRSRQPRWSIDKVKSLAVDRCGACTSEVYSGWGIKHDFVCAKGHPFRALIGNVVKGRWCPECKRTKLSQIFLGYSIEEMKEIAEKKGGQFLSNEYKGVDVKHLWKCCNGHEFLMRPWHVFKGHWCSACHKYMSEEISRMIVKTAFKKRFPRSKIVIMCGLELDGYCEKLKISFEYQGEWHYSCNDIKKKSLCAKNGIKIAIIPPFKNISMSEMISIVQSSFNEAGVKFPKVNESDIDINNVLAHSTLTQLQEVAESHGGQLLSSVYLGATRKHAVQCEKSHTWETQANLLLKGAWCRICAQSQRARDKGGRFI